MPKTSLWSKESSLNFLDSKNCNDILYYTNKKPSNKVFWSSICYYVSFSLFATIVAVSSMLKGLDFNWSRTINVVASDFHYARPNTNVDFWKGKKAKKKKRQAPLGFELTPLGFIIWTIGAIATTEHPTNNVFTIFSKLSETFCYKKHWRALIDKWLLKNPKLCF